MYFFKILFFSISFLYSVHSGAVSVMATVDDKPITSTDLNRRLDTAIKINSIPISQESYNDISKQVLYSLIEENLVAKAALEMKLEVSEEELKYSMTTIAEENKLSYEQFLKSLSIQGIDVKEFKAILKGQILWNKIITSEIMPNISISEQEVSEQFNIMKHNQDRTQNVNLKLAEIVIHNVRDNKQSLNIIKALKNGADFSKMAKEFSSSISREDGGLIGWLHISQLSNNIASVLVDLSVGQISRPIKIDNSVYIFKILDKKIIASKKFGNTPTRQEKEEIQRYLRIVKTNTKIRNYLDAMRDKYFIEIF